jgi:hypothetical protein
VLIHRLASLPALPATTLLSLLESEGPEDKKAKEGQGDAVQGDAVKDALLAALTKIDDSKGVRSRAATLACVGSSCVQLWSLLLVWDPPVCSYGHSCFCGILLCAAMVALACVGSSCMQLWSLLLLWDPPVCSYGHSCLCGILLCAAMVTLACVGSSCM